nr:glycosyl hydrolase-related protein [uncultured Acetatifactor sp.]
MVRLYEAEGTCTPVRLAFPGLTVRGIEETNMLEETTERLEVQQEISLTFRPFE